MVEAAGGLSRCEAAHSTSNRNGRESLSTRFQQRGCRLSVQESGHGGLHSMEAAAICAYAGSRLSQQRVR